MDTVLFRKKYLGEVTLKNGEHVKFLFPVSEIDIEKFRFEAETTWKYIQKDPKIVQKYQHVFLDDLDLEQFRIVFAGIKKYGDFYWKLVWEHFIKTHKKI